MDTSFDGIIIGAGHNGLILQAYLARLVYGPGPHVQLHRGILSTRRGNVPRAVRDVRGDLGAGDPTLQRPSAVKPGSVASPALALDHRPKFPGSGGAERVRVCDDA